MFFIVGLDEVCGWFICCGMNVWCVVGEIYLDFECGFICAEVVVYDVVIVE